MVPQGTPNTEVVPMVLEAVINTNLTAIACDMEAPPESGLLPFSPSDPQFMASAAEEVLLRAAGIDAITQVHPNVGKKLVTNADFFSAVSSVLWHEAMHQRNWWHAGDSTAENPHCGSMPYIVAQCMEQIAVASQSCTDACPGELRPVANHVGGGCTCSADPRLVHAMYRRNRGRAANPTELRVALDTLTAGTATLSALENELQRPAIPRVSVPLTMDGFALETAWGSSPSRAIGTPVVNNVSGSVYPSDLSATWQALHDDTHLYFLVDVTDPERQADSVPADQHQDDSIELYIDADGNGGTSYGAKDFQLGFRPGDTTVYFGDYSATSSVVPQVGFTERTGGYRFEIGIPWSMLGTTPNSTIGLEVHVNDDDNGGSRDHQIAWTTSSPDAWKTPSLFTLVALAADVGASTGSVTIDGIANESSWDRPSLPIIRTVSPMNSGNSSGTWRAFWNDTHYYVFVNVTDAASTTFDGPNVWDDDSVEVYFDPDNEHGTTYDADYRFTFRRNDPTRFFASGSSVNLANNPQGIQFNIRNVSSGYALEAAIPWGTLGTYPASKLLLGFDVHINDDDNGGARDAKRAWRSTVDDNWQNPSLFGAVQLTGNTGPDTKFFYTATPPWIDGIVTGDAAWNAWSGPAAVIDNGILTPASVDAVASWRGVWDDDAIYVHIEVEEPGQPVANSSDRWQDDSVELFLDLGYGHSQTYESGRSFQMIFSPYATNVIGNSAFANSTIKNGVQVSSTRDGTGYTMEVKIPWTSTNHRISLGSAIGFDVHVNDDDSGGSPDREGKIAWALSPYAGDVAHVNPRTLGRAGLSL